MALFRCPNCLLEKDVSDSFLLKKVKCPKCDHKFIFEAAKRKDSTLGTILNPHPEPTQTEATEPYQGPAPQFVQLDSSPGAREQKDWNKPLPTRTKTSAQVSSEVGSLDLGHFLSRTGERDRQQGRFELENDRILELNLEGGGIWIQTGTMIAYRGDIRFRREGIFEFGFRRLFKRAISGEAVTLTRAEGMGKLYIADQGKKISLIQLRNEGLVVNGNDLLAFEEGIAWDVSFMKSMGAWLAGGFFHFRLTGEGKVAIATHFDPLTLPVRQDGVSTDPQATVAWSDQLRPEMKTDIQLKTFFGRASGESLQMRFRGSGFVVVQPYENSPLTHTSQRPARNPVTAYAMAVVGILFLMGLSLFKRM